jgi:hypothetical protein
MIHAIGDNGIEGIRDSEDSGLIGMLFPWKSGFEIASVPCMVVFDDASQPVTAERRLDDFHADALKSARASIHRSAVRA